MASLTGVLGEWCLSELVPLLHDGPDLFVCDLMQSPVGCRHGFLPSLFKLPPLFCSFTE